MFGSQNKKSVVIGLGDPGADRDITFWRAPAACEVLAAYATDSVGLAAGTANYFSVALYNGGSSGTATTALGGTVGGSGVAWTVSVAKALTISEGTLAEGDFAWIRYDETGTCAQNLTIQLDYVLGVGA